MSTQTTHADAVADHKLGLQSDGGPWHFYAAEEPPAARARVLLIGDSIMNGYRGAVAEELADVAVVDCWLTGMHLASPSLRDDLAQVLTQGPYAVVHFNIGLHGWPEGRILTGQYEPLLRAYLATIQAGAENARLTWASTTQITEQERPELLDPVNNPTIVRRNAIAEKVMTEQGVAINDLYGLMSDHLALARGDKFHWSPAGVAMQAAQVARVIRAALG